MANKRANPEAQLHRAVAEYLRVALKPPTIWTTIGHGGGGRVRGAQLKAMGVQAGWPDIIVLHPNNILSCVVACIELKASKGTQSKSQKLLAHSFDMAGANYSVCRTLEQVERALLDCNIPLHARTS